jgi:hypothetical protein
MITTTHVFFNHLPFLPSKSWHCAHQRWNSHLSQHCHRWSNTNGFTLWILRNLRICCLRKSSSQGEELLQLTPHSSFPPFSNWGVWMFGQTSWCVLHDCANAMWNFKGPEGQPLSILITFLHKKILNYITKDANILHIKSSGSSRSSYFLTSNLQDTPPITTIDLVQVVGCLDKETLTSTFVLASRPVN